MQGIDSREYRILAAAFDKLESVSNNTTSKLEESDYSNTKKNMEELDALYFRFQSLCSELGKCIQEYEVKKKTLRSLINKSNRKLVSELHKNKAVNRL